MQFDSKEKQNAEEQMHREEERNFVEFRDGCARSVKVLLFVKMCCFAFLGWNKRLTSWWLLWISAPSSIKCDGRLRRKGISGFINV